MLAFLLTACPHPSTPPLFFFLPVAEAHKARGNFAYCTVVKDIGRVTKHFRVLALSATPGSQITYIKEVLKNLFISHIETRGEEDEEVPVWHEVVMDWCFLLSGVPSSSASATWPAPALSSCSHGGDRRVQVERRHRTHSLPTHQHDDAAFSNPSGCRQVRLTERPWEAAPPPRPLSLVSDLLCVSEFD